MSHFRNYFDSPPCQTAHTAIVDVTQVDYILPIEGMVVLQQPNHMSRAGRQAEFRPMNHHNICSHLPFLRNQLTLLRNANARLLFAMDKKNCLLKIMEIG